jgi:hypothetical protein
MEVSAVWLVYLFSSWLIGVGLAGLLFPGAELRALRHSQEEVERRVAITQAKLCLWTALSGLTLILWVLHGAMQ